MKRITRSLALDLICEKKIELLNLNARESYVLDWWSIDEDDSEFSQLSLAMQNQILSEDEMPYDISDCKYNELISIALKIELKGVSNRFISKNMLELNLGIYDVYGEIESLQVCFCCDYRTMNSRAEYEICRLCGWEDDGETNLTVYSGPNHMSLEEGKAAFSIKESSLDSGKWIKNK